MIVDARKGNRGWIVWDCRTMRIVPRVLWANDETAEFGQFAFPYVVRDKELQIDVHRAESIVIDPDARLVLIDPVDDDAGVEDGMTATMSGAEKAIA